MSRDTTEIQQTVIVCTGSDCRRKGARELLQAARRALKKGDAEDRTVVVKASCCGLCKQAPVACVDGGEWMAKAKPKQLRKEIARALLHRDPRVA
jgi:NADH:ubiquinone oxidoreductase subunit E